MFGTLNLKPRNILYGHTHTGHTTLILNISNHPLQHQASMQLMKAYELAETSQETSITTSLYSFHHFCHSLFILSNQIFSDKTLNPMEEKESLNV